MTTTIPRARWGQTAAWAVVVLLVLVGLANSVYLLDVHVTHKLGKEVEGYCDISEGINCLSAVDSPQSTVLGVPVPVFALAFYGGLFALLVWVGVRRRRQDAIWQPIILLFAGSVVYSLYLLYVLIFELDAVCPGCLVLDVVNIAGLVLSCAAGAIGPVRLVKSLPATVFSSSGLRMALVFAFSFALVFVAGTQTSRALYHSRLGEADRQLADSQERFGAVTCGTELWAESGPAAAAPVAGNPSASVVILDFSDFECPYCTRLEQTFADILAERGHEVQIRFLHYPLNVDCNPHVSIRFHEQACVSAQASVCAQEQDRFWEMHDLLYANARRLTRPNIDRMAISLGLDMARFEACMDSDHSLEFVRNNAVAGHQAMLDAGIQEFGTPFFFVNGLPVRGARPRRFVEAIINAALEASAGHHTEEHAVDDDTPSIGSGEGTELPTTPGDRTTEVESDRAPTVPSSAPAPRDLPGYPSRE
ncbi:MAG: thioredoxin domain-containing protein [Bradymonadales bacterium]|nr:thioredoxin domain-containing protein [Bradymonadales bacterium]